MQVVRWMGAFRKGENSLFKALNYELQSSAVEKCAEPFFAESAIKHCRVGLQYGKESVVRTFKGDVWSEYEGTRLHKTRKPNNTHAEAWVCGTPKAIVVYNHISKQALKDCLRISTLHNVPCKIFNDSLGAIFTNEAHFKALGGAVV